MSTSYKLVPEEQLEELSLAVSRLLRILSDIHGSAGDLTLPDRNDGAVSAEASVDVATTTSGPKYKIRRGGTSYMDVVNKVMPQNEFTLDEVVDTIMPLIDTDASRPRDSIRTALDRADELERVGDESRWRRVEKDETREPSSVESRYGPRVTDSHPASGG